MAIGQTTYRRADRALYLGALVIFLTGTIPYNIHLYKDYYLPLLAPYDAETSAEPAVAQGVVQAAAEQECLAEAMYYEARGEGAEGEKAVAEVVLERLHSRYYPASVCGVVHEGADQGGRHCQFSFACNGALNQPRDRAAWDHALVLATSIMSGKVKTGGETNHAIAYHNADISPPWADDMTETAQIGNHIFYRRSPRVAMASQEIELLDDTDTASDTAPAPQTPSDEIQSDVQVDNAVGDGA